MLVFILIALFFCSQTACAEKESLKLRGKNVGKATSSNPIHMFFFHGNTLYATSGYRAYAWKVSQKGVQRLPSPGMEIKIDEKKETKVMLNREKKKPFTVSGSESYQKKFMRGSIAFDPVTQSSRIVSSKRGLYQAQLTSENEIQVNRVKKFKSKAKQ